MREAEETDVPAIRDIFRATYGDAYIYPQFYDELGLKKMIFGDATLMLVAGHDDGRVLGTASVVMEVGAYSDLLGEFGRLAVHPDARGHGVGRRLMTGRLERVEERLHVGIMEARVIHPFSQRIAVKHGFAPVGFLPMKVRMGQVREHVAILVRHFGPALELRRNNPRIVPEVHPIACLALEHVGIPADVIVDEESAAYPSGARFEIQEMTAKGYSDLLRIERGRLRSREVFGPLQLHYGLFMLKARRSNYLIARDEGRIVGAIGYTVDAFELNVRVFELITLDDQAVRFLFEALLERCRTEYETAMIEIDASADAPRLQRTLLELGFVPCAYVPAMAFQRVERRDVVKFARLLAPLEIHGVDLIPRAERVAQTVIGAIRMRAVEPRIAAVVDKLDLFAGLNEEQVHRIAGIGGFRSFQRGDAVIRENESGDEMYLVLSGEVDIHMAGCDRPVGRVGAGESLGETAVLTGGRYMAGGTARTEVELGVIPARALQDLVRIRPDIGVIVFRNLARGLRDKLQRADSDIVEGAGSTGDSAR